MSNHKSICRIFSSICWSSVFCNYQEQWWWLRATTLTQIIEEMDQPWEAARSPEVRREANWATLISFSRMHYTWLQKQEICKYSKNCIIYTLLMWIMVKSTIIHHFKLQLNQITLTLFDFCLLKMMLISINLIISIRVLTTDQMWLHPCII